MNGLALCAGIGGIELGIKLVYPSYRTICYVEREAYNAACLVERMEEGFLDKAPIWSDISTFKGNKWYRLVDIVSSGLPCQPFSVAGRRRRTEDERHLWPHERRIINECRPQIIFLENTHITAFEEPFKDLQKMEYHIEPPYQTSAAEMGAGHIRRRVFLLAYTQRGKIFLQSRWGKGEDWKKEIQPRQIFKQPSVERWIHGIPNRVERDRALGNAVIPAMAAKAFSELIGSIE